MRKTAIVTALLLALGSPSIRAGQSGPEPTERKPSTNFENAYPRWMCPRSIYSKDTTLPSIQSTDSMAMDSRGVLHLALSVYPEKIYYRNSWTSTRDASGFTRDASTTLIADIASFAGSTQVTNPDVCIETNPTASNTDRVVVVFQVSKNDRNGLFFTRKGSSGWSAPVQITPDQKDHYYFNPQAVCDDLGTVHVFSTHWDNSTTAIENQKLNHAQIRPDDTFEQADVANTDSPSVNLPRAAFRKHGASSTLAVAWKHHNTQGTLNDPDDDTEEIRFALKTGGGSWTITTLADFPDNSALPDIALDSTGQPHIVYANAGTLYYRAPTGGSTSISSNTGNISVSSPGRILIDSRNQLHVLYGRLHYAARVKNPNPDELDSTWHKQEKIVAPRMDTLDLPDGVREAVLSRNDDIHVLGVGWYTRTCEYNLGVRDGMAMAPVFPGGAVNVTNGNLLAQVTLFTSKGVGPSQAPALIYNALGTEPGLLGPGWRLNYESSVVEHKLDVLDFDITDPSITLHALGGRTIHFKKSGSHYVADDEYGYWQKLELDVPNAGKYRFTSKHGDKLHYDDRGRFFKFEDAAANALEITWDSSGLPSAIKDMLGGGGAGRTTNLAFETGSDQRYMNRLKTVTDPRSKVYELNYTGRNLTGVEFRGESPAPTYTFEYYNSDNFTQGERANLLKVWKTPRNAPWTCQYLSDNRVSKVLDPMSAELSIVYPENLGAAAHREAKLKNRRGFDSKFVVDARRALALEYHDPTVLPSPPAGFSPIVRNFNTLGNLTSVTDRWGQVTSYEYYDPPPSGVESHVKDVLRKVTRPLSAAQGSALYEDYTSLAKPQKVTTYVKRATGVPSPRETGFSYDGAGRVTTVTFPDVTRPDSIQQTGKSRTFSYAGPRGALSAVEDEEDNVTTYSQHDTLTALPGKIERPGAAAGGGEIVTYDALGNVETHRLPPAGPGSDAPVASQYTWDGLHRLKTARDPALKTTTYDYWPDSLLKSVTPPAGTATTYAYDSRGFMTGMSGPDGSWTYVPDEHGNLTSITNPRSGSTTQGFDSLDRLTSSSGPDIARAFSHDGHGAGGHFSTATLGGRQTKTTFDGRGRATKIEHPDGSTQTLMYYDEDDQLIAREMTQGALLNCTVYFRDARGRVDRVSIQNGSFSGGTVTNPIDFYTLYDPTGGIEKQTDGRGTPAGTAHATIYMLDSRDRTREVIDGRGFVVRKIEYGDDDLPWQVEVPNPATKSSTSFVVAETRTYTARKELKSAKNGNNVGMSYTYGPLPGQVDVATDALGRQTKTNYHATTQRPSDVTIANNVSAESRATFFEWENGLLKESRVWAPNPFPVGGGSYSAIHGRTYDSSFRLTHITGPLAATEEHKYDPVTGDPYQVVISGATMNRTVTHQFNGLGQPYQSVWTGVAPATVTRQIDGAGNVTSVDDGTLKHEVQLHKWRGVPDMEKFFEGGTLFQNQTLIYDFDNAGNYSSNTDTQGKSHILDVDASNRPTSVSYDGQSVHALTWTPGGLLDRSTLLNTVLPVAGTVHEYDALGRRTRQVTVQSSTGKTLSDYRWAYDAADRVDLLTLAHLGTVIDFDYNARNELIKEETLGNGAGLGAPPYTNQIGGPASGAESVPSSPISATPQALPLIVPPYSATYELDRGGNRTSQIINGALTTFWYNSASQLEREVWPDKTVLHEYDEFGNQKRRTTQVLGSPDVIETFSYNYMNRLDTYMRWVSGGATQAHFAYKYWPSGARHSKQDLLSPSLATEVFIPRFDDIANEYDRSTTGSPPVTTTTHKNTYAQGLELDSKVMRVSNGGTKRYFIGDLVGTLGMALDDTGVAQNTILRSAFGNAIAGSTIERFGGLAQRELDPESGLTFVRHRMYDPRTGRFTQTDPLRGNRPFKHYAYASNNPVSRIDPMGLQDEDLSYFTKVEDLSELGDDPGAWGFQRGKAWYWRPGAQYDLQYRAYLTQRRAQGLALDTEYLAYLRAHRGNTIVAEGMTIQQILELDLKSKIELSIRHPGRFGRAGMHEIFSEAEYRDAPGVIQAEIAKGIAVFLGRSIAEGALGGSLKILETAVERRAAIEIAKRLGAQARTARTLRDLDALGGEMEALRRAVGGVPQEEMAGAGVVAMAHKFSGKSVIDILKLKKGSITNAPLPEGAPTWDAVRRMSWDDVVEAAERNEPGFRTIKKLLTDKRFDR